MLDKTCKGTEPVTLRYTTIERDITIADENSSRFWPAHTDDANEIPPWSFRAPYIFSGGDFSFQYEGLPC